MTSLLELREKIKLIYSKNEVFIIPVAKFLLAFLVLSTINGQMGYMAALDNLAIVLIVALMCSFLPTGCILLFLSLFSLAHMYALSMEVALVGMCIYLLFFLLYLRFSTKESLVVVITILLCIIRIPYIMPVAMGLLGTPASAIAIGGGIAIYYMITAVVGNASTISTMNDEDVTAKIRLIVDAILDNKAMLVMIAAFAITVIVVYLIRRMSIDYSWTVAIVAGVMINLVIMLVGDLVYSTNLSVLNAIIGAVLAVAVAKVIEFFRLSLDYSRTEKVQFEDDEYYYYVKAVPKMTVAVPTKTVKKINIQQRTGTPSERNNNGYAGSREGGNRTAARTVSTERTAHGGKNTQGSYGAQNRAGGAAGGRMNSQTSGRINSGRSVTINSNPQPTQDAGDDFEELF